jgi:hypothetical protein
VGKSGLSIQTLVISSLSAVAAAIVIPMFWERGTLIAAAMTPVIVALVSEALRKPAEKITAVTPKVTRRGTRVDEVQFDPLPPGEELEAPRSDDPFGLRTAGPRPRVRHHWRLALATGAAAFAIAVVGLTMSELVLGGAATRDSGRTTFFPGREARDEEEPEATPTATPEATEEEATPAPTATPTPAPTPTPVPPTETPAPTPTPVP